MKTDLSMGDRDGIEELRIKEMVEDKGKIVNEKKEVSEVEIKGRTEWRRCVECENE